MSTSGFSSLHWSCNNRLVVAVFCRTLLSFSRLSPGVARTFKVFDRFDSQLQGGVLVTNKDGARVLLEGRHRPHVVHSLLDGFIQSEGFVCSCDQNHHLSSGQQRGQTAYKQAVQKILNIFHEVMQDRNKLTVFSSDLFGVHDSSHAHSQSHGGDLGQVVAKETSIGHDGVLGQSFHSGPGNKAGAGLVERDVSVRANTCSGTRIGQRLSSRAKSLIT